MTGYVCVVGEDRQRQRREGYRLKGANGFGPLNSSGSFAALRMTAGTGNIEDRQPQGHATARTDNSKDVQWRGRATARIGGRGIGDGGTDNGNGNSNSNSRSL